MGGLAVWQSARLPFGGMRSPGPGFFPWWASLLIVALALLLLVRTVMEQARTAEAGTPTARESGWRQGWVKVSLLIGALALYVAGLEPLGYPLCTFLLVLFMLRVLEPQRWRVALSMAVGTAAASYVLFAIWLKVPLPPGPFFR